MSQINPQLRRLNLSDGSNYNGRNYNGRNTIAISLINAGNLLRSAISEKIFNYLFL